MIELNEPLHFSEVGKKDNQEDVLYPSAKVGQRVFVLCDGMGGHERGELAATAVAYAIGNYIDGFLANSQKTIDTDAFYNALETAYDTLDAVFATYETTGKRPGTTLACIVVNDGSVLVAHIGDSRILHIRPGVDNKILYESTDHSLVNDLILSGEITREEALSYGKKNIITRAMQPGGKRFKADVYELDDIRHGDYFFLCSDGVLEHVQSSDLCNILTTDISNQQKLEEILNICRGKTFDNHSCWLIPVKKAKIKNKIKKHIIKAETVKKQKCPIKRLLFKLLNKKD